MSLQQQHKSDEEKAFEPGVQFVVRGNRGAVDSTQKQYRQCRKRRNTDSRAKDASSNGQLHHRHEGRLAVG